MLEAEARQPAGDAGDGATRSERNRRSAERSQLPRQSDAECSDVLVEILAMSFDGEAERDAHATVVFANNGPYSLLISA